MINVTTLVAYGKGVFSAAVRHWQLQLFVSWVLLEFKKSFYVFCLENLMANCSNRHIWSQLFCNKFNWRINHSSLTKSTRWNWIHTPLWGMHLLHNSCIQCRSYCSHHRVPITISLQLFLISKLLIQFYSRNCSINF